MWHLGRNDDSADWERRDSPLDATLTSLAETARGPHAAARGGALIARDGDGWQVAFDDGPAAEHRDLLAAAATDDGERVWVAGQKGALGFYDVTTGQKHDWSQPTGSTGTFDALAVAGPAGDEKLLVAGSGTVRPGYVDDCRPNWDDRVGIDSTGTVTALDTDADGYGYAATTNGRVYETTPDDEWRRLGLANAQVTLPAVHATENYLWTGDTNGRVYRYDREQPQWTTLDVGESAIRGFGGATDDLFAVGDGGAIHGRDAPGTWHTAATATNADLYGAVHAPDVCVGRDGTIVSRTT